MGRRSGRPRVIHSNLSKIIEEHELPGYVIAAVAGIAPWQLYGYSTGRLKIGYAHLRRLCKVLDADPEDILG